MLRTPELESCTPAQFFMNYDLVAHPVREDASQHDLPPTVICTPMDLPSSDDNKYLPSVIQCQEGEILKRRKVPAALRWSPKTNYAEIVLFTVSNPLTMLW